jgi:hypothetical protein
VLAQKAQLRQPRYVVAMLLGGLYLWFVVAANGNPDSSPFTSLNADGGAETVVAAVLLLLSARWWLSKPDRTALAFTPAEVHLLFPAPISRRELVQSKLVRGQLAILLNVLIWVVLLRGSGASIEGWQRGIALWILFSTFTLHRLAAALVRLSAAQNSSAGRKRAALPIVVFVVMFGTIATLLWQARPAITSSWVLGFGTVLGTVHDALQHPAARIVLAPVQALVAPVFATSSAAWLLSLGPALLVLLLHFMWVVRTDAAFEEAALEASQERAKAIASLSGKQLSTKRSKRGAVARVLPMPRFGHPAIMIAWKNHAAALRGGGWLRQLAIFIAVFAGSLLALQASVGMPFEAVLSITVIWGFMLLLLGPVWTRFDLRLDLRDLGTIRTLPLSGRSIVSAEIVGVSILHSITIFSLLMVPVVFAIFDESTRVSALELVGAPWPAALTVLLLVPMFNLLTFTVQNGLALLYPAWVQLGTDRRGFEAMGQTMLTFGITLVVAAVALVFPALIGLAMAFIGRMWWGAWSVPVATAIALAIVLAELVPIWMALGSVFEKTEPGDVPGQKT